MHCVRPDWKSAGSRKDYFHTEDLIPGHHDLQDRLYYRKLNNKMFPYCNYY